VDDLTVDLVSSALQLVQSSSPNYLLLASLDAARWQLAEGPQGDAGRAGLQEAQRLADLARKRIATETRLGVLACPVPGSPVTSSGAFVALDPLRLTVHFPPAVGVSGYDADEVLIEEYGVYAELPASRTLTFAFGLGTTPEDVDRLVEALAAVSVSSSSSSPSASSSSSAGAAEEGPPPSFPAFDGGAAATRARLCGPRAAYFTPSEVLATDDPAILGKASAETICPYPPGIPILLPGEVITADVLAFLKGVLDAGGSVTGCSDPTLGRLRVLRFGGGDAG
jgi:arginine decarboxylase